VGRNVFLLLLTASTVVGPGGVIISSPQTYLRSNSRNFLANGGRAPLPAKMFGKLRFHFMKKKISTGLFRRQFCRCLLNGSSTRSHFP